MFCDEQLRDITVGELRYFKDAFGLLRMLHRVVLRGRYRVELMFGIVRVILKCSVAGEDKVARMPEFL
jgi:hypothetical protein